MSNTKLVAQPRTTKGSPAARRLRAEGHIPGVIYGQGMTPVSVTVERRDLRLALSGPAGSNTVLTLEVDGKSYPAVVKDMQRHPIRRTVAHIDFLQVNLNEEIVVAIPVRLEGEAKAVISAGGLVDPAVDTIEVSTTVPLRSSGENTEDAAPWALTLVAGSNRCAHAYPVASTASIAAPVAARLGSASS